MMKLWLILLAGIFLPLAQLRAEEDAAKCKVHVLADDSFEMFVNGNSVWKASSFDKVASKEVMIKPDDVVVFAVTDKQGGRGGFFSTVIERGATAIATTRSFRYATDRNQDLLAAKKIPTLKAPEFSPLSKISFGLGKEKQPDQAWSKKVDQDNATIYFRWLADK